MRIEIFDHVEPGFDLEILGEERERGAGCVADRASQECIQDGD